MKKVYTQIHAVDLNGQEEDYFFPLEKELMTPAQKRAMDERSTEEIINEDGEIPTLKSHIYPYQLQ